MPQKSGKNQLRLVDYPNDLWRVLLQTSQVAREPKLELPWTVGSQSPPEDWQGSDHENQYLNVMVEIRVKLAIGYRDVHGS